MKSSKYLASLKKFPKRSLYILIFIAIVLLGGVIALARNGGNFSIFASGTSSVSIIVTANGSRASGASVTFANQSQPTNSNGVATFSVFYDYPYPTYTAVAYYGSCTGQTSVTVNGSSESGSISMNCQGPGDGGNDDDGGGGGGGTTLTSVTPPTSQSSTPPYVAPGSTYSIHGIVKSSDGLLLQNANVSSSGKGGLTDGEGKFSISGIPINTGNPRLDAHYVSFVKYPGYTPKYNVPLSGFVRGQTYISQQDYDLGVITLSKDINSHIIHGKVTDQNNSLLEGVNIVVKDVVPSGFEQHQWSGKSQASLLAMPADSNYEVGVNVRDDTYSVIPTKTGYVLDMNGDNIADPYQGLTVSTTYSDPNLYIRKNIRMVPATLADSMTFDAKFKLEDKDTHAAVSGVTVTVRPPTGSAKVGTSTASYQDGYNLVIKDIPYKPSTSSYNLELVSSGQYRFKIYTTGGYDLVVTRNDLIEKAQITLPAGSLKGSFQRSYQLETIADEPDTDQPSDGSQQCNLEDPSFEPQIRALLARMNEITGTQQASLNPEQINYAINLLDANDDPMLNRFVNLLQGSSLNMNDVGSFLADFLGSRASLPPEVLNLLRNIEQPSFGTYLATHRADVNKAINLARSSDPALANLLTDIVNDTSASGFKKDRAASKIAEYVNNKYHLGAEAVKLITEIQKINFGKYVAQYPGEAAAAIEIIREKDSDLANRLEKLFSKSTIKLSDVLAIFGGTRTSAINQTQKNLKNIKINLTSGEYARYQAALLDGKMTQSEIDQILLPAVKRALLKAGSPLLQYEASRLVAILLKNPETFESLVTMLDHTTVNVSLVNQLLNDGSFVVDFSAQPVYASKNVGAQLKIAGKISTGKMITEVEAGYNTCADEGGFLQGEATGRLTGNLRITPRRGSWSGSLGVNSTGAWAEYRISF